MKIAVLPGDGIGPEIVAQAVKVLNALDIGLEMEEAPIGGAGYEAAGDPLPDATLKNLLEHFSGHTLSLANVPEDELGNGYEFLIKKFADDSGHTAQEFYTNRTVVHLMVQMLEPKSGESIYDPTCGTGGMLISALAEVKRKGGEHRTLKLFGQERNHMTASIARMNLVLHGVEDCDIARGDTLAAPAFYEGDKLRTFDVVLANPPHPVAGHAFINFIHEPHIQAIETETNRYATPDSAAKQFIDPKMLADEALFVPDEVVAKLEPQKDNSSITQRQDIWAEFKSKIGQG